MFTMDQQNLLVIAPHPDDEVLGCGGLIHRIKSSGGKVYVLFLTLGTTADYSKRGISTSLSRGKEIIKVMKFLDVDDYDIAFPGNKYHLKLDSLPSLEIIDMIEKKSKVSINKIRPTVIATTQITDYNQDHRAAAKSTIAALRPAPHDLKLFIPLVLGYEFAANSWNIINPQSPNFYISLQKKDLSAKIKAMDLYKSQTRAGSHTRSSTTIKSLAKLRGAQCGSFAAEAYYCYRFYL
ncbi:hypothetical protein A2W14_06910 [Candidatus Gottesmanbacteria bacterium RBG_16_37_8]|uniref:GlcNAc-PI de-N-acetylase n=1 Tax=Candidatus Gottesmanbacteria bacterium RBG_16_37_8 TaxID=1798371 RepID=A0A1F5YUC2_9BACT|nr:MAG: hypothetical protein A2W14_06910 [Candidatus Gottesmanbacteria bacterium RBG_16_37_8]